MKNTPGDCSDETINDIFELASAMTKRHARALMADPTLGERLDALNAETLLGNQPLGMSPELQEKGRRLANEIDLRRKYDIQTEYHGSFRGKHHWSAIDANSYTGPDPDGGVGSCVGTGESEKEAKLDLLDKIADAEAKPKPRIGNVIGGNGNDTPLEYSEPRETDVDLDNQGCDCADPFCEEDSK